MYKSAAIRFFLVFPSGVPLDARNEMEAKMRKAISRGLELSWSGFLIDGAMTQVELQAALDAMIEGHHFPNLPNGGDRLFVDTSGASAWEEVGASHETTRTLLCMDGTNKVPLEFKHGSYSGSARATYSAAHVILLSS